MAEQKKFAIGDTGESKVTNVVSNGTWKEFFKFDYILENGLGINAMHKTNEGFKVGDTVQFEVKRSNQYGLGGTIGKPQEEGSNYNSGGNSGKGGYQKDPKTQMLILAQSTLAKAIEVFQAGMLDDNIQEIIKDGKTSKEDALCIVLHSLTGKLMRSQIALADELSK